MNPLVRYLETGEPCQMLGMVRCGDRLAFCIRAPDGTVIACGGRDIERWSADVHQFPQQPASTPVVPTTMLRRPESLPPVGSPANHFTR